ncbi:YibE/F family protein [Xylanimonas oleitrophica]|uniref:YibE/F family protein n=1 Tax=Xylanimonas oleitrophica TaxID=2607479 RepID=A0A2W5WQW2_9MICO|nr:YibE/F family protein [Xylanimonas oleitrophica]PZR53103.1 YibE/F family protein [Xylanimonas oleitrophica]
MGAGHLHTHLDHSAAAPSGSAAAPASARPAPASLRTRVVLAVALLPALLATVWGAFALWPAADEVPAREPVVAQGSSLVDVTVTGPWDAETGTFPVELPDGGTSRMQWSSGTLEPQPGDTVVALHITQIGDLPAPYAFIDFQREAPLGLLAVAFVLVVLLVARWRGLAALAGLGFAFAVFLLFTVPALLAGHSALPVALVTSSAVMFVVLYLAHGFTTRTTTALLGTLVGLALTAGIGTWAIGAARVTGAADERAAWLPQMVPGLSLQQIALCGLVLAGMGVLNDVTITQASAVWELRELAPHAPRRVLFARAMRIGRDHIASTVYTMAFAYVGAALAVLMNLWLMEQPVADALSSNEIAEEIVRTLVGSIGLVLAIPATTGIAALAVPGPTAEPVPVGEVSVPAGPTAPEPAAAS